MQKLLCIILLATVTPLCFAQQTTLSVAYLKNGSVVKGKMFAAKSGDRVKMETPDGSTVLFTKSDITEIKKENYRETPLSEGEDKLYLQNGSIINGKIRKARNSDRMRIETPSGSVVYFTENLIKEIVRADDRRITTSTTQQPRSQPVRYDTESTHKTSGYKGILEAGYSIKMGDISTSRLEITTSHGYQINPRIFLGLGIGVNIYSDGLYYDSGISPLPAATANSVDTINAKITIPIFADFRFNFLDNGKIIPYAGLKAGYTLGFFDSEIRNQKREDGSIYNKKETSVEGIGFYMQPSVGVKFILGRSTALNLSLGYALQTFDHYYKLPDTETVYKKTKNNGGINFRVGFEF